MFGNPGIDRELPALDERHQLVERGDQGEAQFGYDSLGLL